MHFVQIDWLIGRFNSLNRFVINTARSNRSWFDQKTMWSESVGQLICCCFDLIFNGIIVTIYMSVIWSWCMLVCAFDGKHHIITAKIRFMWADQFYCDDPAYIRGPIFSSLSLMSNCSFTGDDLFLGSIHLIYGNRFFSAFAGWCDAGTHFVFGLQFYVTRLLIERVWVVRWCRVPIVDMGLDAIMFSFGMFRNFCEQCFPVDRIVLKPKWCKAFSLSRIANLPLAACWDWKRGFSYKLQPWCR